MDQEWIWLAGLLEGEGYFGATKQNESRRMSLRVTLNMTDRDVVEHAHRIVGSDVKIGENRKRPAGWNTTFSIQWIGSDAEWIMRTILPLMGERRKARIEWALRHDLCHHRPTHCKRGHRYEANTIWNGNARKCRACERFRRARERTREREKRAIAKSNCG